MTDGAHVRGRISGQRYCELPEVHRTILLVGMADMLQCLARYLPPRTQAAFQPILQFMNPLASGDLRAMFDDYVAENPTPSAATASALLSMLIVKSGANRRLSETGDG